MSLSEAGKAGVGSGDGWTGLQTSGRGVDSDGERPVNLVHLSRQTFGDKRLETELLRLFMRQAEQILASLEGQPVELLDRQSAGDLLHTLLGSARVVGATAVAALAQRLEAEQRRTNPAALADADRTLLHNAVMKTNAFIAELLEPA
jgi:HPt (histidine-containing phosphotransfer) domain-containing protein